MDRERRSALAAGLVLALVVVLEFRPALSLGFAGDDFELLSLARIGGFAPGALALPHRGAFVKPVLNALWAALAGLFGANPGPWYTLALLVHLLDATLLGWLAYRLAKAPRGEGRPAGAGDESHAERAALLTGLGAALVWAVHDRLAEPVFSVASLNHSITFAFYLGALLMAVRVLTARSARARLLVALFTLLTLFSYEVGASVLPAFVLVATLAPAARVQEDRAVSGDRPQGFHLATLRWGLGRITSFGLPLGAVVLVWALVQAASRLSPGAASYYVLDPATWLKNIAEIGLGFLHLPSYRIEPKPLLALPFVLLILAVALWPRLDRVARFGCAWAIVATLPVLPIPFFSDRYHYIVFAGLALAVGRGIALLMSGLAGTRAADRGAAPSPSETVRVEDASVEEAPVDAAYIRASLSRSRLVAVVLAVAVLLLHVVWSIAGSREQAAYYTFKSRMEESILRDARTADEALAGKSGVIAVVWQGRPDAVAGILGYFETVESRPCFSDSHPVYVRPQGILGVVYPMDLFNTAAADRGGFYRRPAASDTARAIAEGTVRIVPVSRPDWWGRDLKAGFEAGLAARLRDTLLARREIPLFLPGEVNLSSAQWRFAWLEPTDRAGAFAAEYEEPSPPAPTLPPP